jgi:hypothetical protein
VLDPGDNTPSWSDHLGQIAVMVVDDHLYFSIKARMLQIAADVSGLTSPVQWT